MPSPPSWVPSPPSGDVPAEVPVQNGRRPDPSPPDADPDTAENGQDDDSPASDDPTASDDLVRLARRHAAAHHAATGRPITRDELRAALRVANGTASQLLRAVRDPDRPALVPVPAAAFARPNRGHPATDANPEVAP